MVELDINGKKYAVAVEPDANLLWVIRDHLDLKGAKYGCGIGECGSCTVHVEGEAVRSCTVTVGEVQRKRITTIEGLPENHPVKRAWIREQVPQCGYCQPGVIMHVAAHLSKTPTPDADQVTSEMDDVICRCGTYPRIKQGIKTAIQLMTNEDKA